MLRKQRGVLKSGKGNFLCMQIVPEATIIFQHKQFRREREKVLKIINLWWAHFWTA